MVTFQIDNLDPLFVFNKVKMISVMDDICALLSLANGPKLKCVDNQKSDYTATQNDFLFQYTKNSQFDNLKIVFKIKSVFLLKLKNINSTSVEITLNIKQPELEIKEILHLFEPFFKKHQSINKPSDG